MLLRLVFCLALFLGMAFAPVAMAAPRAHHAQTAASPHCAQQQQEEEGQEHAPAKQFRCMGGCSAVEAGVTRLAVRTASPLAAAPIPVATSLGGILLDRDTPPPRAS